VTGNGDGDHDPQVDEELDLLVIAMRAAREQVEQGAALVQWGEPVVRFVHAVAQREAERYPPPLREEVEKAVARGVSYALSACLKVWFSPELTK
jgi:hypothetical protein